MWAGRAPFIVGWDDHRPSGCRIGKAHTADVVNIADQISGHDLFWSTLGNDLPLAHHDEVSGESEGKIEIVENRHESVSVVMEFSA